MIDGLDSAGPPSPAQVAQAKAAGFSVWSGYLASRPNVGLLRAWTKSEFDVARQCGGMPLAYCSGWDNPAACRDLAAAYGTRLCLDIENGIRGDGAWADAWLKTSGAGIYGGGTVHKAHNAAFHIYAAYPGGDPGTTWPPGQPRPMVPLGWQFKGSTSMWGTTVDLTHLDDWFGATQPQPQGDDIMAMLAQGDQPAADPHGPGAVYLVSDYLWKRWISGGGDLANYVAILGQPKVIKQEVLDRCIELPQITSGVAHAFNTDDLGALKGAVGNLSSVPGPPGQKGDPGPPGPPPAPGTSFTAKIGG